MLRNMIDITAHRESLKTRKTFYRFLFSSFVIFLFPVIIFSILVFNYLFNVLQDDAMATNLNNLEGSQGIMDAQIQYLKSVSEQVYTHENLQPFRFEENPGAAITIVNTLKSFVTTNSFCEDIVLYFPGDNYIYSSNSSNTISRFINEYYHYENWDEAQFYHDINTITTPTIRPAETVMKQDLFSERMVTFIYPLSYNAITPSKVLLFLVPENRINMLFENHLSTYNGNYILLDPQDQIISSLTYAPYLETEAFQKLPSSLQNHTSKIVSLDGEKFLSSFVLSANTDWKYITLTPVKEVMRKINITKFIIILLIFFVLIAGCLIIYFFTASNYKPIQRLKQFSEKILNNGSDTSDDLETIKNTLVHLNISNHEMHDRLESTAQAAKEHLLIQLLQGHFTSANDFNAQGKPLGMAFTKSLFRVIMIHIKDFQTADHADLITTLESFLPADMEGYIATYAEKAYYVLVSCYDTEIENKLLNSLIQIQDALQKVIGSRPTIGLGQPYDNIGQIPKSYVEALNAMDYKLIKGTGKIISFQEIADMSSLVDLSLYRVPEHLNTLIKQGNVERIENILVNISEYLKQNNTSIFTARLVCSDVINSIIQTLNELSIDYNIPKSHYPDILMLAEFETIDDFVNIVKDTIQNICDFLTQTKEEEGSALIEQMLSYIKEKYTDYDFSIQNMADYFHLTLPNLSRYFKDHTSYSVLDYVTHLKIEKAKNLLAESDMTIKDIAANIGYYNVTSFIRRFKQMVGLTPGEYRKQAEEHRKQ